jgi:hypothetical protein
MGSGDPSGLQNRRELASLALVSSTLTRFRQFCLQWFPELQMQQLPIYPGADFPETTAVNL